MMEKASTRPVYTLVIIKMSILEVVTIDRLMAQKIILQIPIIMKAMKNILHLVGLSFFFTKATLQNITM